MSNRLERSIALMDAKADVKMIKERANECWYDTKILANAVYLILDEIMADRKDENSSEKPNNCKTCRFDDRYGEESICSNCSRHYSDCYAPKVEQSGKE